MLYQHASIRSELRENVLFSMTEFRIKYIDKYVDTKLNWGRNPKQVLYCVVIKTLSALEGIKLYRGNLKISLHMHTPNKGIGEEDEKEKKKKTIHRISFISIFKKGLSRGFHLINAKRQPNNSLLCSKIRNGKRWKWACRRVFRERTIWFLDWKFSFFVQSVENY